MNTISATIASAQTATAQFGRHVQRVQAQLFGFGVNAAGVGIGQHELERPGQRIGFGQPQPQDHAQAITGAGRFPGQHLRLLVMEEPLVA